MNEVVDNQQFKVECSPENAPKFLAWIAGRGGVAVWRSADLANPGASWSTPALAQGGNKPYPKPSWQSKDTPEYVVSNPEEIGVIVEIPFRTVPVALRRGSQGFVLKLTDKSREKLDRVVEECKAKHGNAHWHKGPLDNPCVHVYYTSPEGVQTLAQWQVAQPPAVVQGVVEGKAP